MSIQSSVNALIGSIGAVRKAHDFKKRADAMLRVEEQKASAAEQRALASVKEQERKSTPLYQQAELEKSKAISQKKRNERYAMTLEMQKIKQGVQDGTKTI